MTFSRSPLWAPLGPVAQLSREDAHDRTSGESDMETPESHIITTQIVVQYRGTETASPLGRAACSGKGRANFIRVSLGYTAEKPVTIVKFRNIGRYR